MVVDLSSMARDGIKMAVKDAYREMRVGSITKREHFAAMAMQGMLAAGMATGDRDDDAMEAVRRADALLEALEVPDGE